MAKPAAFMGVKVFSCRLTDWFSFHAFKYDAYVNSVFYLSRMQPRNKSVLKVWFLGQLPRPEDGSESWIR